MTPTQRYESELAAGVLQPDPAQRMAVDRVQRVYDDLVESHANRGGIVAALRRRLARRAPAPVRGLYLWGQVGRGKTHIVNMLHDCLPFPEKMRIHFHGFMQGVHDDLKRLGRREDPLALVARATAERTRVICFDEFHVADIADAMILARLFDALFRHGVALVATSNIAPRDLYRDGLQRERFLPVVDLIERHTEVVEVDGPLDYRLRALVRAEIYHQPLDASAETSLTACFQSLAPENVRVAEPLEIASRAIATRRVADGIAWFDFPALFETPRAVSDYMEIARQFHTVLISSVPVMGDQNMDRVVRFIHLVDEFYDRNVNLIVSAAAPPDALYTGRKLGDRFARTRSRLEEMRSRDYLARTHLP